jgi:2-methylisocitrate lyase-like PEP mutase family enzyme
MTQNEKAQRFRALHDAPGTFVIPNPWDAGSARLLASLGFPALATSSAAAAGVLGRRDGQISRDQALDHVRAVASATDLPVSADLEKGFGDDPAAVAETIRLAAAAGAVGGSIEDATGATERPLFEPAMAAERVAAAVAAARALPFSFTVTARAEGFLRAHADTNTGADTGATLADVIARLQAFERAGADVLFAPGLPDLDAVRAVCAAVTRPVNFMIAIPGRSFSIAELAAAGVKRISLASSLYRAAMTGLYDAAREVKEQGTCHYLDTVLPTAQINQLIFA